MEVGVGAALRRGARWTQLSALHCVDTGTHMLLSSVHNLLQTETPTPALACRQAGPSNPLAPLRRPLHCPPR